MSNTNTIFIVARGTPYSLTSFDGTTYELASDNPGTKWRIVAGTTGKFLFGKRDQTSKSFCTVNSITDNVNWNVGVLPQIQNPCITAVSATNVVTSFDGSNFYLPGTQPRQETYYLLLTTRSSTLSTFSRPAKIFAKTMAAVVNTYAFRTVVKSAVTHYRTFTANVVTTFSTFTGLFKW